MKRFFCWRAAAILALAISLNGCSEPSGPKDYLKISGGGFVFNYRYSHAYYVFVAQQNLPLPQGSILEAAFDVPGSAERFTIQEPAFAGKLQYKFQSENLVGIVKDHPYKVTLRLIDGKTGAELDLDEKTYKSDIDQSELPKRAPVEGVEFAPITTPQ